MTYADYVEAVPVPVRLMLAVIVTLAITMAFAVPLHKRAVVLVNIGQQPKGDADDQEDAAPPAPKTDYLAGRVMGFTTTAFVFLLAFTLGQMWSNAQEARGATQTETANYVKALTAADAFSDQAVRERLSAAVQEYRESVITAEWPLLQRADTLAATEAHQRAAQALAEAMREAVTAGAAKDVAYGDVSDGIEGMVSEGDTRLAQLPGPDAPGVLFVIFLLGITALVLTAVFQPTRARPYLLLIGVMAVLTALLFFLVLESTNPFIGAGAVPVPTVFQL